MDRDRIHPTSYCIQQNMTALPCATDCKPLKVPAGNFYNLSLELSLQGSNAALYCPRMKILRRHSLAHYTFLWQPPKVSVEYPSSLLSLLPPPQILQEIKGSYKIESSLWTEFSSDEVGTLLLPTLI